MRFILPAILISALSLSACGDGGLRDLRTNSQGPDEFIVTPPLPLQQPDDYTSLPQPDPGGRNITDPTPIGDAIAALGGRQRDSGTVPAADGGMVAYVSRNGVTPGIREVLAEEDADFRRRKARFTNIRLFPEDRYDQAYEREALNPNRVARAFRRAGVPTPSAPPAGR